MWIQAGYRIRARIFPSKIRFGSREANKIIFILTIFLLFKGTFSQQQIEPNHQEQQQHQHKQQQQQQQQHQLKSEESLDGGGGGDRFARQLLKAGYDFNATQPDELRYSSLNLCIDVQNQENQPGSGKVRTGSGAPELTENV